MCIAIGAMLPYLAMAGTAVSTIGAISQGMAQNDAAKADAESERYAADQHAAMIRRATRKQVGAARAAMAGSGTALDEFSMINTNDIERMGASDEAQTMLDGELKAMTLLQRGKQDSSASYQQAFGSLLQGAKYTGWKGAKSPTKSGGSDPFTEFYQRGTRGVGD